MPGYILTTSSTVMCMHGGTATLTTSNTKMKIDGSPALLESDIHPVAGCPFTIPPGKPSPCIARVGSARRRRKCDGTPG